MKNEYNHKVVEPHVYP